MWRINGPSAFPRIASWAPNTHSTGFPQRPSAFPRRGWPVPPDRRVRSAPTAGKRGRRPDRSCRGTARRSPARTAAGQPCTGAGVDYPARSEPGRVPGGRPPDPECPVGGPVSGLQKTVGDEQLCETVALLGGDLQPISEPQSCTTTVISRRSNWVSQDVTPRRGAGRCSPRAGSACRSGPNRCGRGPAPDARDGQRRNHGAVQVTPRRLAVQQHHWFAVPGALIEVVHPHRPGVARADIQVTRFEGIALEVGESGSPGCEVSPQAESTGTSRPASASLPLQMSPSSAPGRPARSATNTGSLPSALCRW